MFSILPFEEALMIGADAVFRLSTCAEGEGEGEDK